MPLPCTVKFQTTEAAAVRAAKSKVSLVLGNYCTDPGASASSSGDYSTDYPAAGAIDGDRVELNVGPAASAENHIGKSSWRSDLVPDQQAEGNVYLIVDFGATRTINRLRVYYLTGHALTSYKVQYWTGSAWADITLSDEGYDTLGYGLDEYGASPYGTPSSSGQGIWGLSNNFADVVTTKIKIIITATAVAHDYANIVEVEAYRVLDISSRVPSWRIDRARDFKLKQDMSSAVELSLDNSDKFFSSEYTPTAAQITAGFVNSELRSGLGVEVKAGFEWSGSQFELLPQFTGFIDSIECQSKSRTATIQARDNMKTLLATIVSSEVKTGIAIELAIAYILNLCNISSYDFEIDLNKSKLTIPYFFVTGKDAKTIIDELVVASGDAQFYFDEAGIAIYRQYTTLIPNNYVYYQKTSTQPGQPGWSDYGSKTNVTLDRQTDQVTMSWVELSGWKDGNFSSNPAWTKLGPDKLSISSQKLVVSADSPGYAYNQPFIYIPLITTFGQWQAYVHFACPDASSVARLSLRLSDGVPTVGADSEGSPHTTIITNGYEIRMFGVDACYVQLWRYDGATATMLAESSALGGPGPSLTDWLKVIRKADGTWKIYFGGVLVINTTDNTYTSFTHYAVGLEKLGSGDVQIYGTTAHEMYFSQEYNDIASADDSDSSTPVWISNILDLGTDVVSLGTLDATIYAQSGCTPTLYTQSSANGSSWDAYVQVNPNAAMGSTARRYLRIKMAYSSMNYNFGVLPTPFLKDMVVNWTRSGEIAKYPVISSRALAYNGSLIDVKHTATDTLGGDTSILNDVLVVGQPYNLTGTDADVAWEYLTGIPAAVVSATNPLFVNTGTIQITANIPEGMDTSRMTGTDPDALNIVWGTAVGSAEIIKKSPINPVIELIITTAGTISSLQLLGKTFSNSVRNFAAESKDAASIVKYGLKNDNINNSWILNNGIAAIIAASRLANYKDETKILSDVSTTLQPSSQMGDRVTVTDLNTAISADYWVIGLSHYGSASQLYTVYKLWKIPAGM